MTRASSRDPIINEQLDNEPQLYVKFAPLSEVKCRLHFLDTEYQFIVTMWISTADVLMTRRSKKQQLSHPTQIYRRANHPTPVHSNPKNVN